MTSSASTSTPTCAISHEPSARSAPNNEPPPLTYRWVEGPNISLTLNSLDDPEAVRPQLRYSAETEVSWCGTLDSLPTKDADVTGDARFVNHQWTGA